jgi:hypothetical protein
LAFPPALYECERLGSASHSTSVLKTVGNCKQELRCDRFLDSVSFI